MIRFLEQLEDEEFRTVKCFRRIDDDVVLIPYYRNDDKWFVYCIKDIGGNTEEK